MADGEVDELLSLLPVPSNPECHLDLELCKRLFRTDHIDDPLGALKLVESVGYVPRRVERGPIGSSQGERGKLERRGYTEYLAESKFFNRLGHIEFQSPFLDESETRVLQLTYEFGDSSSPEQVTFPLPLVESDPSPPQGFFEPSQNHSRDMPHQGCSAGVFLLRLHKLDQRVSLGSQPFVLKNQSCYRINNYSLGRDLAYTRFNHLNQSCHRELLSADGQFSNLYLGRKIPDR